MEKLITKEEYDKAIHIMKKYLLQEMLHQVDVEIKNFMGLANLVKDETLLCNTDASQQLLNILTSPTTKDHRFGDYFFHANITLEDIAKHRLKKYQCLRGLGINAIKQLEFLMEKYQIPYNY